MGVLWMTYKGRHDTSAITNGELQARRSRTLSVSRQICRQPRERNTNTHVQPHSDQEAPCVVHRRATRADQHGVPDDTDDAQQDAVESALLLLIREVRNDEVGDGAESIARDGEDLHRCARGLWHDGADDGGQEGREAVEHSVGAELRKAEQPHLPVFEALPDVFPVELGRLLRVSGLTLESRDSERLLLVVEKVRRCRFIWQDPPCSDA